MHVLDPRARNAVHLPSGPEDRERREAGDTLELIKRFIENAGVAPVEQVFEIGVPAQVLVRVARGARMLVLGHGERHRLQHDADHVLGAALGSVSRACVARAQCPVVVVPAPSARRSAPTRELPPERTQVVGARAVYPYYRGLMVG